jgi:drug/metabolite transporter (DMT)-like permease
MPFYVYAWIASFFFGIDTIISKLTSKYAIKNPWYFNFLWSLLLFLFMLPIALINHVGIPKVWDNILLVSLLNAVGSVLYIFVLYKLDVSVFSPLFNFRIIFTVILGALMLGEMLTVSQYALVCMVFVAGIAVSIDEKLKWKSFFRKPILVCILLLILTAFMNIFLKKAIVQNGFWEVNFWSTALSLLFICTTVPFFRKELNRTTIKQIGIVALIALSSTIGNLTVNTAYAKNVSISSVIIAMPISMIMAFILSIVAPKLLEKHTIKIYAIRFIGATVMIIAALKLSS